MLLTQTNSLANSHSLLLPVSEVWADFTAPTAFNWPECTSLGERLEAVAKTLGGALSVHAPRNCRERECVTLVHGDVKPGNIFLDKREMDATAATSGSSSSGSSSSGSSSSSSGSVTMIDFQWTGLGLGASDVTYLLAMAPSDELLLLLEGDGLERDFLRVYYDMLCASYRKFHSNESEGEGEGRGGRELPYTYEEFHYDFQLSLLDFMRWMVPARLAKESPEKYAKRRGMVPLDLNMGAYRRSPKMMKFLMERVRDYLPLAEALNTEDGGGS